MKTKTKFLSISLLLLGLTTTQAQIGIGTTSPDASAMLEVESTEKGFLPPRMTTNQRNDINSPAIGLQIFNLDTDCIEVYFVNGGWKSIGCSDCLQAVWNFTNCSQTGRFGPSQAQCNSSYSNTNLNGNVTISTQGIQEWMVPFTGTYKITVAGAKGGTPASYNHFGSGARMIGEFNFTSGQTIRILVGQSGTNNTSSGGGAGGGASFVTTGDNTPLIVAGGGGGGGNYDSPNYSIMNALTSNYGPSYTSTGRSYAGGGGGSFSQSALNLNGGSSFIANGVGGAGTFVGGFGGGGGHGDGTNSYAAGGGGYSGGDEIEGSSLYQGNEAGGGSFNIGSNQNNTTGANTGHGYVTIQRICL